jgi:hypothetical protein
MSFVTKKLLKNWLLIFLLVTNVATISTILYHRWNFRRHEHDGNSYGKMKEFINNDLGLSAEQKLIIDNERKATDSTKEILFGKMETLRILVYSQFASVNPDSVLIDSLVRGMSSFYSEINSIGISHNLFMLNVCNAEQKAKLQKKYEEMITDMKAEQAEDKEDEHEK